MRRNAALPAVPAAVLAVLLALPAGAGAGSGPVRRIAPRDVSAAAGTVHGEAAALSVGDQRGSDDDPARYLLVEPESGRFDVRAAVPLTRPPAIGDLRLAVSIRSSERGWWRLQVRDRVEGSWTTVLGSGEVRRATWVRRTLRLDPERTVGPAGGLAVRLVGGKGPVSVDLLQARATVWQPAPGTTWQWQLTGEIDTGLDVEMYDVDLFDVSEATIGRLHDDGRVVVCYFSAGAWEHWRPDAGDFPPGLLGAANGWPGERWLDVRNLRDLRPVLAARLDLAVEKGCDGVEPDNVDGYANRTGFPLTPADQIRFNRWLAAAAHRRGLSVGLKNDLDQVGVLHTRFDWALDEQCFQYDECGMLEPFVAAGKAVFGVEYRGRRADFCPEARSLGFSWLLKRLDLGAWVRSC